MRLPADIASHRLRRQAIQANAVSPRKMVTATAESVVQAGSIGTINEYQHNKNPSSGCRLQRALTPGGSANEVVWCSSHGYSCTRHGAEGSRAPRHVTPEPRLDPDGVGKPAWGSPKGMREAGSWLSPTRSTATGGPPRAARGDAGPQQVGSDQHKLVVFVLAGFAVAHALR